MKKPKVPQRLNVEVILYKFYTISCFDANTGLPIFFSGNFIPDALGKIATFTSGTTARKPCFTWKATTGNAGTPCCAIC